MKKGFKLSIASIMAVSALAPAAVFADTTPATKAANGFYTADSFTTPQQFRDLSLTAKQELLKKADLVLVVSGEVFLGKDAIGKTDAQLEDIKMTEAEFEAEYGELTNSGYDKDVVVDLKVESVSAITDTKLSVTFSSAVDSAAKENFSIPGLTVAGATLSDDKKSVELQVTGAEVGKAYTLTATGLKVNAETQDDLKFNFTMPDAASLFQTSLTVADERTVLKADGKDSTLITFKLTDAQGNVMTDASNVEVAFTSTFGNFAEKRVTLQNGTASALLTSESLSSDKSSLITATVVEASNRNLINLKAERNILMSPNPDAGQSETVGATLTDIGAEQADRLTLYFNKDVKVSDFAVAGTSKYNAAKAEVEVYTEVPNTGVPSNTKIVPEGYLPVPGNSKALYALLPTTSVLKDNTNVLVKFSDKTGTVATNAEKMVTLTDARKPAMLGIAREGLNTLKVTFSEPVIKGNLAPGTASAEDLKNWVIDGLRLDNDKWGVAGSRATAVVGTFDSTKGEDNRHVVTIKLGKKLNTDNVYFNSGSHSIQGSNIGDWANLSDVGNNVLNTQTLDFDIPVDNEVPAADVLVQSPEQYIVTFNKELVSAATNGDLKLQRYNTATSEWVDVPTGLAVGQQNLRVTAIDTANAKYKVEVEQDWTTFYNTSSTNKNYYNDSYRLHVAKDTVTAASNGKKNVEINLPLGGVMTTPDVTSPTIDKIDEDIVQGAFTGKYKVTMSEPVQLPGSVDATPSQAQGGLAGIPQPTADFIKKDGSLTVPAKPINNTFLDKFDKEISVEPSKTLEPGEWTLVVRSISDDVGNTAASATKDFTVKGAVATETDFKVLWAYADTTYDAANANGLPSNTDGPDGTAKDAISEDAVYVKFSKPVSLTGSSKNALSTTNYTLNGAALPEGTQIVGNVVGYDDKDEIIDSITIVLPNGTLNDAEETVITVSSFLESKTGEKIVNGGQFKLSYNINTVETTNVVVNDIDELEAALADSSIRSIVLGAAITGDVSVNRAVDIDLAGFNINGDLSYDTTDGATINLSNTGAAANVTGDLTVNTPNSDFNVGALVTVDGTTTIVDVASATFTNNGTLHAVVITDSNGTGFVNASGATVGAVTVDTNGAVTLGGDIATVLVKKAAKLTLDTTSQVALTLAPEAKGVTVTSKDVAPNVTDNTGEDVIVADKAAEAKLAEAKKALTKAITDAKEVDTEGKTKETVTAFEKALTDAEAALVAKEATFESLTKAQEDLVQAVKDLEDAPAVEETELVFTATAVADDAGFEITLDVTAGTIAENAKAVVSYSLGEAAAVTTEALTIADKKITVEAADLAAGEYTGTVTIDGEPVTFTFKVETLSAEELAAKAALLATLKYNNNNGTASNWMDLAKLTVDATTVTADFTSEGSAGIKAIYDGLGDKNVEGLVTGADGVQKDAYEYAIDSYVMNTFARYLGAIGRGNAVKNVEGIYTTPVSKIIFNDVEYTWNGTLSGSNWKALDDVTLVSAVAAAEGSAIRTVNLTLVDESDYSVDVTFTATNVPTKAGIWTEEL